MFRDSFLKILPGLACLEIVDQPCSFFFGLKVNSLYLPKIKQVSRTHITLNQKTII
jgi:hypothetical protein